MTPEIFILSIVYLFFDIFFSLVAMLILYEKKPNIKLICGYAIIRILFFVRNALSHYEELTPLLILLSAVLTILIVYMYFDKNIGRGIIKICVMEFFYAITIKVLGLIFSPLFSFKLCYELFSESENYYLGLISLVLTYPLMSLYAVWLRKILNKDFPQIIYNLVTIILIGSSLLNFLLKFVSENSIISYSYSGSLVITMLTLILAALIILNNMKYEKHLRQENEYLTRLNELQYEHYTALNDYQQQLRVMRHDIVNHLHTIQIMTDNGDTAECRDYADELIGQYRSIYTTLCENKPVDALLHSKISEAQGKNITLTANVSISEDTNIKPVDLVCIFSNLLDNAITAAENSERKTVAISAVEKNDMLTIKCENSFSGNIKIRKDFTVKTTKDDSFNHGLGTGIIKSTAEKYGGSVFCETVGDTFTYIVSIPKNINEPKGENHA